MPDLMPHASRPHACLAKVAVPCLCLVFALPEVCSDEALAATATDQPRWLTSAHAQSSSPARQALDSRLRALVREAKLGEKIGVAVADTETGRMLFQHRAELPLNPASNMKLVTSAVALSELGPSFRMRTGIYGRLQADAVQGGLYLKGYGDPTLRVADLIALARQLAARGIRKVDEVLVDDSYFDAQILPPAFEQQPEEPASFRAAIAALSVDRSAYTLRVRPGSKPGEPARVQLDAPGYFELQNQLVTSDSGTPKIVAIQRPQPAKLSLLVRGSIPKHVSSLAYRRRVAHPRIYAGYAMVDALRSLRVQVPRRVSVRAMPDGLPLLAVHRSPSLGQIVQAMGKWSDNFTAEMVLKVLAAERSGVPGRSEDGARLALAFLEASGAAKGRATVVNGSGLFDGNALAASHLVRMLLRVHADSAIRAEYLAHLATGGVDGTLARRLQHLPRRGIVRAKTGTLNDVIALSGYVLGPHPRRSLAFSVLANGVRGKHHAARQLADRLVKALADELYAPN